MGKEKANSLHELSMKGVKYFHYIMDGSKLFEGRVNGSKCRAMKAGDLLKMVDSAAGWGIICRIVSKDEYKDFKDMLMDKGVLAMLPQLAIQAESLSEDQLIKAGLDIYHAFPGSYKVKERGAIAIGVEFIRKV